MSTALINNDRQTNAELIDTISFAHHEYNRQQAGFLIALGHFDQRELAPICGAKSSAAWITRRFDVADSTAYDYLRVSRTLMNFEQVAHSFSNGRLNYSKVRLLGRYLDEENEVELVLLAESMSYRELVRALAGRNQPDEDGKRKQENTFDLWVDSSTGNLCFKGRLDPILGQQLLAALKVGELANLVDLSDIDPEVLGDEEKLDEALAAAEKQGVEVEAESVPRDNAVPTEERSASRYGRTSRGKLMSAFQGLINIVMSSPTNKRRAPGTQVHVVFTEDGHAFMPGNPAADASGLTGAILNSEMRGHLLDSAGSPLQMGRRKRLVTEAQALAILTRWMFQCAMPSCNHTQFIEFHHIVDWIAGGLTNPENLLPLCSHCHSLVTKELVTIDIDAHTRAKLHFRFRDGTHFVSENRSLPLRGGVEKPYVDAPLPEPMLSRDDNEWSFADDA